MCNEIMNLNEFEIFERFVNLFIPKCITKYISDALVCNQAYMQNNYYHIGIKKENIKNTLFLNSCVMV